MRVNIFLFLYSSNVQIFKHEILIFLRVCGREFKVNFQLTRHMRVHTGDKPYACNVCGRKFGDYSTCKKHQR